MNSYWDQHFHQYSYLMKFCPYFECHVQSILLEKQSIPLSCKVCGVKPLMTSYATSTFPFVSKGNVKK